MACDRGFGRTRRNSKPGAVTPESSEPQLILGASVLLKLLL
jgi:hypothetical protein